MKFIIAFIMSIVGITAVNAENIEMFGREQYGFNQPKYLQQENNKKKKLKITILGENNSFPVSSSEQGSVFSAVFEEVLNQSPINILFTYKDKNYDDLIRKFERGEGIEGANGYLSYYKSMSFENNKFFYPAFFYNNVHIITTLQNKLNLQNKNELKNYKGIYAKTDKMAEFVIKEFNSLNIEEVENLPKAFEMLLTGKVDYVAANYYPSQIEAYKLGIHDFLAFSSEAVWKQPMFLRIEPKLYNSPYMKELQKIFTGPKYEKIKEKTLNNLLELYKENTRGIVPPTYVRNEESDAVEEDASSSEE